MIIGWNSSILKGNLIHFGHFCLIVEFPISWEEEIGYVLQYTDLMIDTSNGLSGRKFVLATGGETSPG